MGKPEQCVDIERKKPGRPKKHPAPEAESSASSPNASSPSKMDVGPTETDVNSINSSDKPQQESRKRQRVEGAPPSDSWCVEVISSHPLLISGGTQRAPAPTPVREQSPLPLGVEPKFSFSSVPSMSSLSCDTPTAASSGSHSQLPPQQQSKTPPTSSSTQDDRKEKELLNSAVTFLLDQVRSLSQAVDTLRHEVKLLKSNQGGKASQPAPSMVPSTSVLSEPAFSSSSTPVSLATPTPTSFSSFFSSSSQHFQYPFPSTPMLMHTNSGADTSDLYPAYHNSSLAPSSTTQYYQHSTPFPPSTSFTSSIEGHTVSASPLSMSTPSFAPSGSTTTAGPLISTQYIPLSSLPYNKEILQHFPFLTNFDLASSNIPFVVDDIQYEKHVFMGQRLPLGLRTNGV